MEQNSSHLLSDYHNFALDILARAKLLGTTDAEVRIGLDNGFSISVREQNPETIEHHHSKNLEITVYFGYKVGKATTSDFFPEAVSSTLHKASYIANLVEEDLYVGLAAKELMALGYPDLDLHYPWQITIAEAIAMAKKNESRGLDYHGKIVQAEEISVTSFDGTNVYANSHDFLGVVKYTRHSVGCTFIVEEDGQKERDGYYSIARSPMDLEDGDRLATTAAERVVRRLGARKITTRKAPVLFFREPATSLVRNFLSAISGSNLYRDSSFLVDSLGRKVFASTIEIIEDPHIPRALGSVPFDSEGVKLCRNNIVTDGLLQRYLLDSYSARKLSLSTTGNGGGIHNIIVQTPRKLTFPMLLKKMGRGLLVTEFLGGEVNIITGNYSRGVFGYWVEHGAIQYPVTGVTIAGNLKDIFLDVMEIGDDVEYSSNILTGSILVGEMTIAGS